MNIEVDKKTILDRMFSLIVSNDSLSAYAFKGGYVLSNFICKNSGLRSTSDLDVSVESKFDFQLIIDSVSPYLNSLKQSGVIYDYKIKEPLVTKLRNVSGGIKVYRKKDSNSKKYVFVGIDVSIHSLSYGLVSIQGVNVYSIERSLADKLSAMYSSESTVVRRVRDLYDLYIFNLLNYSLDERLLSKCLRERNVDLSERSTVELMLSSKRGCMQLKTAIESFLKNNLRVEYSLVISKGIDFDKIIQSYYSLLDLLRGVKR